MIPDFYIHPPTRLEDILWKIPRYGRKRQLEYIIKYFIILRFVTLCTGFYHPVPPDMQIQNLVMPKLSLGQFSEIENILLEHFKNKLSITLKRQAVAFICTKHIENLGGDND